MRVFEGKVEQTSGDDEEIEIVSYEKGGLLLDGAGHLVYISRGQIDAVIGELRRFQKEVAE